MTDSLRDLSKELERFAGERDWEQFHSPKNLASALVVEASELLEHFQWMTEDQSRALPIEKRAIGGAESADVLLYRIHLADALDIDPIAASAEKLELNNLKYPVARTRRSSKKYDKL